MQKHRTAISAEINGHITSCIDLRAMFGRTYRCEFEESYYAEKSEDRAEEAAWLTIIPCKWGHIYPHGARMLAAYCGRRKSKRDELASLDCVTVHVEGDCEVSVLFDVADFDRVAAVMKPRRRRRLSPERKGQLVLAGQQSRFRPEIDGVQVTSRHLGRVPMVQGDLLPVQPI